MSGKTDTCISVPFDAVQFYNSAESVPLFYTKKHTSMKKQCLDAIFKREVEKGSGLISALPNPSR